MAKKILVIDDDEGILEGFRAILESAGYEVETSPDVEVLLNLSKDAVPDLILLDVLLSGTDGREICKQLKRQKKTKYIPLIMVSAAPGIEKTVKEAGANDFLAKPFEMENLLKKVERYM